jgi:high-affinity K+ transport system ATPase subunit B
MCYSSKSRSDGKQNINQSQLLAAQTNKLKIAEKKTQERNANLTTAESKLLVVLKEHQAVKENIKERASKVKEMGVTTVEELKPSVEEMKTNVGESKAKREKF